MIKQNIPAKRKWYWNISGGKIKSENQHITMVSKHIEKVSGEKGVFLNFFTAQRHWTGCPSNSYFWKVLKAYCSWKAIKIVKTNPGKIAFIKSLELASYDKGAET